MTAYDVMVTLKDAPPFQCAVEAADALHAKLAAVKLAERAGVDPWAMTSASALPIEMIERLAKQREARQ